ncbi:glycosyltransferase family 2 protein [Aestuariimicrobium sp. Y1814]|uniref:glycosyltransferase family 2 protein n=1 Tax=Aestuariimicrobium sp. Y1814 TaxID=3418742 RepID=UPI003DA7365B
MTSGPENGDSQDLWAWARDPDDQPDTSQHTRAREQDWAWAHKPDPDRIPDIPAAEVAAIMVVHQAADWLERTLRALAGLESRPGALVAVDTGSSDRSAMLLDDAVEQGIIDRVVRAGTVPGFGAAVEQGIATLEGDLTWLWLLHDDTEPQPRALEELLLRASADDEPVVLFPKLLQPRRRNHPDQLAEVGSSITSGASRHLDVAPGEIDQNQSDSTVVLGGSTAAMLVRRDVWDQLGGLDANLPLFRDGLDFGWRANAAGHRVVTAPDAAVHHRQEGRFGERSSDLVGDAATTDRLLGMRVLAAHSANPGRTIARMRGRSVARGVGYLLGKAPGEAMAEFRAAARVGADRALIQEMSTSRHQPQVDTAALRPGPLQVWRSRLDRLTHTAGEWRERDDDDSDTSLDDLTGDDFAGGRRRARLVTPGRLFAALVVVGFLIAWRGMFGRGQLVSLRLMPAPDSLSGAWAAWLQPTAGQAGANPGWLGLTALGSTLAGGSPEVFARLLVLGAPVLGAFFAHRLAKRIVGRGWVAAAFASVWPALAILSGTTFRGSISGALLVILLPLVGLAGLRWFTQDDEGVRPGDHLRAPASLALWLGLAAQGAPAAALVGLGAAIAWWVVHRRFTAGLLVAALGPMVMLLPWAPRLVQHPGRLLTGTDPTSLLPGDVAPAWHVLLGRAAVDGLPPMWVSALALAGMAAVTLLAVLLGRRRLSVSVVLGFMASACACLVLAAVGTRLLVTIDGQQVRPALDVWLLIAGGLVLCMCLSAMRPKRRPVGQHAEEPMTTGSLAATLAAALVGILGVATAVGGQGNSPLRVEPNPLPAYVADVQQSSRATRTLVVQVDNGAHQWMLTSRTTPGWGAGEAFPVLASAEQSDRVAALAARIANGTPGDDLAQRLAELGIAHVVARGAEAGIIQGVSNAPGLTAAQLDDGTTVWTVEGLVSRAATVGESGELTSLPSAEVSAPGVVRVAELPDERWVVTVGGQQVPVVADPSGFGVRAEVNGPTGPLTWATTPSWLAVVAHLVIIGLLVVLAAPTARRPGARPPTRSLETPRRSL